MKKVLVAISALALSLTITSSSYSLTMSPYSYSCYPCGAAPVAEPCCQTPAPTCPANCECQKCKMKKHHKKHHKGLFKRHHKKACGCPACKSNGCGCQ